jgi:hypothetical protein
MRRTCRLATLNEVLARGLSRLEAEMQPFSSGGELGSRTLHRIVGRTALDVHSLWSSFMRAYYLSLFLEPFRISRGRVRVSLPGLSEQDVWRQSWSAIQKPSKPMPANWEPWWFDIQVVIRLTAHFGATHQGDLIAAFSLPTLVFSHLPAYRNYFAHRSPRSRNQIRTIQTRLGLSGSLFPSDALMTAPGTSTQPVLLSWIQDLQEIAEALCN